MILSLELTIRAWWAHQWCTPVYHTNPLPESASCRQINHRWWEPVSVFPIHSWLLGVLSPQQFLILNIFCIFT